MPEQVQLNIAQPPDLLFKYRFNRQAPAQKVLEAENSIFILDHFDYEQPQGIYAYFKGVKYPAKGFPFPEALYSVNLAKKLVRESLRMIAQKDLIGAYVGLAITPKSLKLSIISRALKSFREMTDAALLPYYLKDRYYSPCCMELRRFIVKFFIELGVEKEIAENFAENLVILIEYDNAYRFRIEDALSEINKERLTNDTRRTLKRLINIIQDRTPGHAGETFDKFDRVIKIVSYLLYIPWIKKAFYKALAQCDFEKMQLDKDDRYHVLLWADYNFLGKTLDDRIQMYYKEHTNEKGELELPPRLTYKANPT